MRLYLTWHINAIIVRVLLLRGRNSRCAAHAHFKWWSSKSFLVAEVDMVKEELTVRGSCRMKHHYYCFLLGNALYEIFMHDFPILCVP